jgi:hypothetical protein
MQHDRIRWSELTDLSLSLIEKTDFAQRFAAAMKPDVDSILLSRLVCVRIGND